MDEELKLLPCPFCAGEGEIIHFHESWYIECTKCNARMGYGYAAKSAVKGQLNFEMKEDCIRAWNSRI